MIAKVLVHGENTAEKPHCSPNQNPLLKCTAKKPGTTELLWRDCELQMQDKEYVNRMSDVPLIARRSF